MNPKKHIAQVLCAGCDLGYGTLRRYTPKPHRPASYVHANAQCVEKALKRVRAAHIVPDKEVVAA